MASHTAEMYSVRPISATPRLGSLPTHVRRLARKMISEYLVRTGVCDALLHRLRWKYLQLLLRDVTAWSSYWLIFQDFTIPGYSTPVEESLF
jgi:hypothetical protein